MTAHHLSQENTELAEKSKTKPALWLRFSSSSQRASTWLASLRHCGLKPKLCSDECVDSRGITLSIGLRNGDNSCVTTSSMMVRSVNPAAWLWVTCTTVLLAAATVAGAPFPGPDLDSCHPFLPIDGEGNPFSEAVKCCILHKLGDTEIDRPIVDFEFPAKGPMRVRRAIHELDDAYIEKYERAYELMRALPESDVRSFQAQGDLHCAYGTLAYVQKNTSVIMSVHDAWLSVPFHRWMLYFHERILGSLIGDDTFALPYWAWDVQSETSPPANTMPAIFLNPNSSLYNLRRSKIHMPPHRADLYLPLVENRPNLAGSNLYNMWRVMGANGQTPETFYGGKYSLGTEVIRRGGEFEYGPHGAIHPWVGNEELEQTEDMGPSYSSGRDPIFFAHHSQTDRLWKMYQEMGRPNFDDTDWLDAEFLFYDVDEKLVRVHLRDALDLEKLGITYEQVSAEWIDHVPLSVRETNPRFARKSTGGILGSMWRNFFVPVLDSVAPLLSLQGSDSIVVNSENPMIMSKTKNTMSKQMRRPAPTLRSSMAASVKDEILVLEGSVTRPANCRVEVMVFVDLPEADENTPVDCAESVGNLYFEREGKSNREVITTRFSRSFGIGSRFPLLGISNSASVTLSFVPVWESHEDVLVHFTELNIKRSSQSNRT